MIEPLLAGALVAGMGALLAGLLAAGFVGGVEGAVCRGGMLLLQAASQIVSVMMHNRCK
ncbi:hypothetical protein [Methylophilus sp. QUAN]|uniref:hypothetical protein n=1 Tax=Methylophilus sp. QUAN TaxID=2781020 RepID=UPI001E2F8302|nr:hypothetical protein [Methylophilus sp. QUAN]